MRAHLIFGTGRILVSRGADNDGSKFLFLTDTGIERPVGSNDGAPPDGIRPTTFEEHDVVIEFQSLSSARVLADKLNLLVSQWDEQESQPWESLNP